MADIYQKPEPKLEFVTSLRPQKNRAYSADIFRGVSKSNKAYYCYRLRRAFTPIDSNKTQYMDWFFEGSAGEIFAAAKLGDDWIANFVEGPEVLMSPHLLELLAKSLSKADQARIPDQDLQALQQRHDDPEMLSILQQHASKTSPVPWQMLRAELGL